MIRPLHLADITAIRDINEFSLGYAVSEELVARQLTKLLADSHHFFLGYEEGGHLVGYVHAEVYESLYSDAGFNVLALAVADDFQGHGIGKQLMAELEKEAKSRSYDFIRLNSAQHRTAAHTFYETIGYTCDKLQKRFLKEISDD